MTAMDKSPTVGTAESSVKNTHQGSVDSNPVHQLLTDNIDLWTSSIEQKKGVGRGSKRKQNLYGIKKLRELILELAVRGKLAPQDPNDEPASELLKRIAAERDQLVKDKKIKKPKKLPEITEEEKPFELPVGWEWVRLQDVIQISSGDGLTAAKMNTEGTIPVFGGNGITGYHDQGNIDKPTLVIGRVGFYCGSIHISPIQAWVTDNAFITSFSEENIYLEFLSWLLKGTNLKENEGATAQPVISGRKVYPIVVAIPPNKEQYRIVAKVDELMALCDQLEQQTEQQLDAHQCLVDTLLDTLVKSQNAQELAGNWARLSEHFDSLFTTEASIDQLKQTILQLAVMGKLVPQNPDDEPASVLLKHIAEEKAQLIKKQKALPPISEEEKPFELPEGWEWSYLNGLLAIVTDGDHQAPPKSDTGIPFLVIGNLNKGVVSFDDCKHVTEEYFYQLEWIRKPVAGDLLYTVTGSFGIPILVDGDRAFCVQRHVAILKSSGSSPRLFLKMFLSSPQAFAYAKNVATGIAQKTVPLSGLRKMPIAIPPEEEQHRIVSKVNDLFALCDQLKTGVQQTQQTQLLLTDTLVQEALV